MEILFLQTSSLNAYCRHSCMAWLQPIWRHNPLQQRCTHTSLKMEMTPCNQFPIHQRALYGDCSKVSWHPLNWYYPAFDTGHISNWILLCLHTLLARKIHTTISWRVFEMPHNDLHMVMNDIFQWFVFLFQLAHIFWVSHQSILGRSMVHPICENGSLGLPSFCCLLVVHNL